MHASDLYPIDRAKLYPLPDFIAQALLVFIQESGDYGFHLLPDSDNILTLGHVFAPQSWSSTSQSKNSVDVVSDTSDIAVGAFCSFQNQTSPCAVLPLPLNLQDGFAIYRAFSTSSTERELYGIFKSLEYFLPFIKSKNPAGLRIHSDSKCAIWNIFKLKCSSVRSQSWAFRIRQLLDSLDIPVQLF